MADATSSDTNSDSLDDDLSSISSGRQSRFLAIVGQKPRPYSNKNARHFLHRLFTRENRGCLSQHKYAVEERLFNTIPSWGRLPLYEVIPMSALRAGHIIMGLTQCGQFVLTYTCNMDLRGIGSIYKYILHLWAFSPKKVARKVAEVTLFGSYTISKDLLLIVAQWPMEKNKIVIHGLHSDRGNSQTTDRAYLTITTLPSLQNCKDCAKVAASYEDDELAANWDACTRCNCLVHGLTVHTTYEVISPYPRFCPSVCLNYWNHVVVNTGNFLHVLTVDLHMPKCKTSHTSEKHDSVMSDMVPLDVSDVDELDDGRTECYGSPTEKIGTPESNFESSPSRDSTVDREYIDENRKLVDDTLNTKTCKCINSIDCECIIKTLPSAVEPRAISVRDKILQDFCEDMSQELSIGSDSITLVKHHSACSPRSTPQRLPTDLKPWSNLVPDSDILRTQNSESSHWYTKNKRPTSPQPSTSQDSTNPSSVTSINSPLHTLSLSPSPCSPRHMSPRITHSFRHPSPRKRTSLHSPPPRARTTHKYTEAERVYEFTDDTQDTCEQLSTFRKRRITDKSYEFVDEAEADTRKRGNLQSPPSRTRTAHKITLEAEKAYEFTDDAQETCEKLSSFRKRRLADKKYEFREEEEEDTENIIPFKHIRDQSEHRQCTLHRQSSGVIPPACTHGRWYPIEPENSESDDAVSNQDLSYDFLQPVDPIIPAKKSVLRPLCQNQLDSARLEFIHSRVFTRSDVASHDVSPLTRKWLVPHSMVKCTAHFKRSYVEVDDEMLSVITDVEDDETGGYVSYQCVLPMHVQGSGDVQMQMISNSKAEKMMLPYVSINQFSFDIETFSHHIAECICKMFKKKYWHCSDYDIEIVDVCTITGEVLCILLMKIQASEHCTRSNCSQERKTYITGCTFTWNIVTNQYKIANILALTERPGKPTYADLMNVSGHLFNPARFLAPRKRKSTQQIYSRRVRYLWHSMGFSDSLVQIVDMDHFVSFYMTPLPEDTGLD